MRKNVVQVKFVGFPPIKSKMMFRMKRDYFLSVAIQSFVMQEGLVKSDLVFVFKSHRIKSGDTPAKLKMKDNDTVEVHSLKTYQAYTKKSKSPKDGERPLF